MDERLGSDLGSISARYMDLGRWEPGFGPLPAPLISEANSAPMAPSARFDPRPSLGYLL